MHLSTECERLIRKNKSELKKAKKVKVSSTMTGSLKVQDLNGDAIFETKFVSKEWEELQDGITLLESCLESAGIEVSE